MLVTLDGEGAQDGRPMLPLLLEGDPHIYFLTHQSSHKVAEIAAEPRVALTVVSNGRYFVVSGTADTSRDPALIRRLWHPSYRAWFPHGKGDSEATVLRVTVEKVNYWEPARGKVQRILEAIKAVVTRRPVETPMKTIEGL